jgi:hypothetical protein
LDETGRSTANDVVYLHLHFTLLQQQHNNTDSVPTEEEQRFGIFSFPAAQIAPNSSAFRGSNPPPPISATNNA